MRGDQTTTTQIHVIVSEFTLEEAGGVEIISYEIDYDMGTNNAEWQELKGFSSNDASLFVVKDSLLFGQEY